jgi:putative ABC transport system permease protein
VSFEGFEELKTIWQTADNLSVANYTKSDITHSGDASMRLYLGSQGSSNWMVLSPAQTTRINFIPILASPKFLEMTDVKVGDKFAAFINGISLILEVKNSVNYFPTMYDTEDIGFVILSRDALLAELNRSSRVPVNYNEIWIRVDESQDYVNFQGAIPQVKREWEVDAERILFKSDPLTLGLRSVIFLGYSLTLLLSLVGFATYMFMSARQRASVYGILRSLGLSTAQLYGSLVLEQLILILSGLGLGIILGSLINKLVLPGLPISFADIPPIPPFVPHEDWTSVFRLIWLMLGGFLFTLALGTLLLWRLKLHQVLRVGEE